MILRFLSILALLIAAALLPACQTRVVSETRTPWNSWAQDIADEQSRSRGTGRASDDDGSGLDALGSSSSWAIAVDAFDGNATEAEEAAKRRIAELKKQTYLQDWWTHETDGRLILYFGEYPSPQSRRAKQDLKLLRELAGTGRMPLNEQLLVFAPVEQAFSGGETDLRSVAGLGAYTLQIGFYEGEGRHAAAEQAVQTLRADDVEAFYYHGPNFSQITVGVFAETEVRLVAANPENTESSPLEMYYSPRVQTARDQFPHNLANGRTLTENVDGRKRLQPSFIVKIPGS